MKTRTRSTRWLGLVLASSAITFAAPIQAGKPAKPPPPQPTPAYVTVPLGGLRASDGAVGAWSADINNAGQVVGGTYLPGYDSAHHRQAFLLNPHDADQDDKPDWFADADSDGQNDLIIGLGHLPGYPSSDAASVNDLGFVVGNSAGTAFILVPEDTTGDGLGDCWYKDVNPPDGLNDLIVPLGMPQGAVDSAAKDINSQGQVVGSFGIVDTDGVYLNRGFLLTPTRDPASGALRWFQNDGSGGNALVVDLGDFLPNGINDRGQIVGSAAGHARLRNPDGAMVDLGAAGTESIAVAINNRGQIGLRIHLSSVGFEDWRAGLVTPLDLNGDGTADTWFRDLNGDSVNDLIVDMGTVERMRNSGVADHGVNDGGSVAGSSWWYRGGYHRAPFLWQNGVLQSLKDLTGGTIDFWDVYAINNTGQIICEANGEEFLATGGACILLPTR